MARVQAQVNNTTEAFPGLIPCVLWYNGPMKSTPVEENGSVNSARNDGRAAIGGAGNALALCFLQ